MWNTCLIGRRWKPREGWSRPVLTGDGDIASHSPLLCGGGSASLLLRDCWRQGALFLWSRNGVRVRCPVPGPSRHAPVAARGWFSFWPVGVPCFLGVRAVGGGFCGGHGPGVTPGPFPNPEAKAWHGDGTAPGRVWESNTPPQTFLSGFPVEPTLRETPPFFVSGDSSAPVLPHGSSPTGSQRGFPGSPLRIPIQTKRKTPLLRSLHI